MAEAVEVSVRAVRDHPDPLPHCAELATPHAFTDDHVPLERRAALERIRHGGIEIAPERDRDPFRYQRSGVSTDLGRDQVEGAEFVVVSPSPPVRKLVEVALDLFL